MKHARLYIFLYVSAAMALDVVYRCLDRVARHWPAQWGGAILDQATGYYAGMALLPVVFWVTRRWPIRLSLAGVLPHVIAILGLSVVLTSFLWGSRTLLAPLFGLGHYDYGDMRVRYFMEFPTQLIAYSMAVAAYTMYQKWQRTKDLETQLVAARLDSLTHQLQPHFLFNALNAVSATMYEDLGRADRMLERICDFLRATLRLPDSPMVPLSTELALARQYLDVMKARLEDQLQFDIHCDPDAASISVPALLLQPLVENAVEHGQDPATGRLNIAIDAHRNGTSVAVTIRDRGIGFSNAAKDGHGLANARRRLSTVYPNQATLHCSAHPEGGAVVEVKIPLRS